MTMAECDEELVSLREAIAQSGIAYADLAERAKVSVRTISYLMNSSTHDPRLSTLRALRAVLEAHDGGQSESV
jgi:transcriptional regulator with XRE-family HTH domain